MENEIKNLLAPHFGHLNFLMKIKRDEISIDDIAELIELIKNKSVVSNLPKDLHSYGSYYTLMKDYFFVKKNLTLIKFIKDNVSASSKHIFLKCIEDEINAKRMSYIMNNEDLRRLFLRWSSRIKTLDTATNYLKSVVVDSYIINALDDKECVLVELKDFAKQNRLIPTAWCIKDKSTFGRYRRTQKMFLLKHQGSLYGVNCSGSTITEIFNSNNTRLSPHDPIYNIARSEMLKLNLFGLPKATIDDTLVTPTIPNIEPSVMRETIYDRSIYTVPVGRQREKTFMDKLKSLFS